jgi:cytochrome c-type biogenesis protein CcmH
VSPTVRRWGPWVAMAVIVVTALAIGVSGTGAPQTNQERMLAIASTLKCEVCEGESVAQSDSDFAKQARVDIAKRLDQGQSADQIRAAYITNNGANVSLIPASTGVSSLVWIIPVVALIISGAVLVMVFRRWRIRGDVHATEADRRLVAAALDGLAAQSPDWPDGVDDTGEGSGR